MGQAEPAGASAFPADLVGAYPAVASGLVALRVGALALRLADPLALVVAAHQALALLGL